MTLSDLIDLEAQLARDRDGDPAAVAARDRALLPDAREDEPRGALLARWLAALREREPGRLHPGRTIAGALGATRAALAAGGFLLGWGAATAVFRYTGGHPVNVWDFLLVFVGAQLALLLLLAGSLLLPISSLGAPLLGVARGLVAAAYPRLAARALRGGKGPGEEWRALWHRLRSRRSLYHAVEPWLLVGLTQAFGVAFNLGALLACLRLVVFSDVAFSWSTTLVQLDAARFHGLVHALAAPWRALWPEAVPSPALVAATRYSQLEGAYLLSGPGRSVDPTLVGGWWPFLVAALVTYGLAPRLLALAIARLRAARLLARLPLDDAEVSRVVRRLVEPHVDARAGSPEAARAAPPSGEPRAASLPPGEGPCAVVLWRDAPGGRALEEAVARQTRRAVGPVRAAGGVAEEAAPVDWRGALDGAEPVVVVAEAFEAPDRAALRLLADLRRALGPRRHLLVLLVEAAADGPHPPTAAELRVWRDGVAALEDPYLAVEPLGAST